MEQQEISHPPAQALEITKGKQGVIAGIYGAISWFWGGHDQVRQAHHSINKASPKILSRESVASPGRSNLTLLFYPLNP